MEVTEIINKANKILENTANCKQEYHEERVLIFNMLKEQTMPNLEILEAIIVIFEKNEKIRKQNKEYKEKGIDTLINNINRQNVRINDKNDEERIIIFEIKDNNNNRYSFLTRENAQKFISDHKDQFDENVKINLYSNNNLDIERIFKI